MKGQITTDNDNYLGSLANRKMGPEDRERGETGQLYRRINQNIHEGREIRTEKIVETDHWHN